LNPFDQIDYPYNDNDKTLQRAAHHWKDTADLTNLLSSELPLGL
jgi:hypothetical protein